MPSRQTSNGAFARYSAVHRATRALKITVTNENRHFLISPTSAYAISFYVFTFARERDRQCKGSVIHYVKFCKLCDATLPRSVAHDRQERYSKLYANWVFIDYFARYRLREALDVTNGATSNIRYEKLIKISLSLSFIILKFIHSSNNIIILLYNS